MHFPYKYATAIRIPPKKIPRNPSFLHIKYTFGKNKEKIKKKKKLLFLLFIIIAVYDKTAPYPRPPGRHNGSIVGLFRSVHARLPRL